MKARFFILALVATAGMCLPARAGFVDTVTTGVNNTYEDISREHVFFNGNASLAPGTVIVGFSQITQKGAPNKVAVGNSIVAVFGIQVTAVSGNNVTFGAISSANSSESLQTLLGMPNLPKNTMAVVFDLPGTAGIDYTAGPPSGATNINGYLSSIASNYNYDFAAGIATGSDFFSATAALPPSTITPAVLNATDSNTTLGSFTGGLSVVQNNLPQFNFVPITGSGVLNPNTGTFVHPQLSILRGSISGANDFPGYAQFGSPGVGDNASFGVHPNLAAVPEPASLVLFGLGFGGLAGAAYRRSRKKAVTA